MTKVRFTPRSVIYAIALFICLTTYTSSAQAQTQRSFVASNGNDANNCLRPTPCRTFNRALVTTLTGGEVVVIDSAGYGPATINKSITISAPTGVQASVTAFSGTAIAVTTGATTVVLRGLTLLGQNTSTIGIAFQDGRTLHVENCVITGFTEAGISATVNGGELFVKDTIVRDGDLDGIFITGNGVTGGARASIDNCRLERNGVSQDGFGLFARGGAFVTVRDTVAANNGSGFVAQDNATQLNAENCVATNNISDGFRAGSTTNPTATPTTRVSNSVATNNVTGFRQISGTFFSRQNNTVAGNPNAGTITPLAAQ